MFHKILAANRAEIAIRIFRACREMGIPAVAIFSDADRDALFTRYADEAYAIGPAAASQSYLNIPNIIATAKACGADAIHPGYGFLAENPAFASACESEGIRFIGPSSRTLELTGDKIKARREMQSAGIPIVPGARECISSLDHAKNLARSIGYPIILKPSGGGGGIGMAIVDQEEALRDALEHARTMALATFGLADVYIEKYLRNPRHIEFQMLADSKGHIIHLGERECSIQRRHQKLIEESPSTAVSPDLRNRMGQVAIKAAAQVNYEGAGTVEFLLSGDAFYFLEINARIQVEHPVTEMVSGIDLIKEQIRIASGCEIRYRQEDISIRGSAIECRINAEDPFNDFAPVPGKISAYYQPAGPGIRVDSGVWLGSIQSPFYDPMMAKLIAWGGDRDEAIARMRRSLYEFIIAGIQSNIPFHQAILENQRFIKGDLGTQFIDQTSSLMEDMKQVAAKKLPIRFIDKEKIAAVAAAAMVYKSRQ